MPHDRATAPGLRAPVFAAARFRPREVAARLLPVRTAFQRFGAELTALGLRAGASPAMTFSPAWWQAVPPPPGYQHRLLLLQRQGELRAAVFLRERTVLGLRTGILHAGDAKGESLVLCSPGAEAECLTEGVRELFRSRRCVALLLHRSSAAGCADAPRLEDSGLRQHAAVAPSFWRTALCPGFDQTLAPFGHRTRRNLRHAFRQAWKSDWEFLPNLTAGQAEEATAALATRATHPYSAEAIAARLELERGQENSFSMGLRSATGEWLSLLTGVRRSGGETDIFWQSNVASEHGSTAQTMRALLMQHEGERGSTMLRWIGGTSPLMEHCCTADPGRLTLITRPGLRLALLRRVLGTPLVSEANPMRKMLEMSGAGIA